MTKEIKPGIDNLFVTGVSRLGQNSFFRDKASGIVYTDDALELAMMLKVRPGRNRQAEEDLKDVLNVLPQDKRPKNSKGRRKPRKKP